MKMDKNLHIPQGYRQTEVGVIPDDWSKLELNDIFNISSKKFNPIVSSENKKCIELEHLSQNTGVLLGFTNSKEQLSIKNIFTKGQILYGKLRPYLRKYWQSEFSGVCSSEIWVLNNKKITNKYLFQFIQTNKFNQVANVSTGSKMPRADWKYMSQIPFIIPPKQEQQKIADILTTWDNAINQQTTLIEKKQQLKKGLMQQLLTAKTRFSEFSDDWEIVKLNNIGITYNGLTKKTAIDFQNGSYKYIAYMNIFSNSKINTLISDFVQIQLNENQNKVQYGDIFFTTSSETPEEVGMSSVLLEDIENTYLNSFCFAYRLNNFDTLLPEFAQFYFRSFFVRYEILRLAQGSTRFNISKKEVLKIKILLPSVREQQKIAQVLTLADDEITKLQTELVLLKIQKKGLMQQLLTGKIRIKI
ncbi:Type I restriction-modification system, specificity subunit S [uncultured Gammaproteobacteria bacterium]|jgi:type I restriction enzyme S subunit|nr:Type I restriction-modification system, specificity subunit S [uncultured Gammaproteobacteria bacterium]CAC9575962.1 Type I restriction-modification system, specificity subunit S [uncultured Gammaproteobacteria bacterium]